MHSVIPGLYNPLAYIAGGGLALRWFRDRFYNTRRGKPQILDGDLYEEMIAAAGEAPPGAEELFFSPHLGGRICPAAPAMRGAWVGFSWGHSQAHFARALLESIAYEYAFYLRILRDQLPGLALKEARAVGGGARSRAWNQIKADVLNMPFRRLRREELGTWGSALIAGKAAGLFEDLAAKAAETALSDGDPVLPDPAWRATYDRRIEQYIALEETLHRHFSSRAQSIV
jgi:xylulokinase